MTVFREGDLEFTFGHSWTVLKYDENGSHYKTTLDRQVKPTKAVDFLCWCSGEPLLMLEVKDFSRAVPVREKFDKIPSEVVDPGRDGRRIDQLQCGDW